MTLQEMLETDPEIARIVRETVEVLEAAGGGRMDVVMNLVLNLVVVSAQLNKTYGFTLPEYIAATRLLECTGRANLGATSGGDMRPTQSWGVA